FRHSSGGHDQQAPAGKHRFSASDRHVPLAPDDRDFFHRDRRGFWRPGSWHRAARLQAGERSHGGGPQRPPNRELFGKSIDALRRFLVLSFEFFALKTNNLFMPAIEVSHLTKRSEEHTSELQSRFDLVCRLLLEKKKKNNE